MIAFQLIATSLSLASAWATGSLHKSAWILLILASFVNAMLYYASARYGHMALDLIYILCALMGLSLWSKKEKITYRTSLKEGALWVLIGGLGIVLSMSLLSHTSSQDLFIDSLSLISGVIGVMMMVLCRIEQWGIWMIHDAINFTLSIRAGLYIIAAKQLVYLYLAIRGYLLWKQHLQV